MTRAGVTPRTGDTLSRTLLGISTVTAATGLLQLLAPGPVLRLLRCENTPTTRHAFATIGMFMVVVGGGSTQALATATSTTPATSATSAAPAEAESWVLWTAVQKLGAAAAVDVGVRRGIFARRARLVAGNDLVSGLLALGWYARSRRDTRARRRRNQATP